jgi:serine/threonine protein kinase
VVLNKTSNSPLNITNSQQIAVILKQNSITVAVFACSMNGNRQIALPKLFHIHHPLIVCQTFSVASSKIQNPWMIMVVTFSSPLSDLRAPTEIAVISDSSAVKWVSDKIKTGDSSVVTFSLDSKLGFTAVKTSLNPNFVELIRREAVTLKTVKHPLIVEFLGDISHTSGHNSVIVTEFAGNGSLANHLSSAKYHLISPNKIARIIVGIALAMGFLHSRYFIHCDLKPDNILLDWDWNVRIADFGQSISLTNPEIPSLIHPNKIDGVALIDSYYLTPECYNNLYSQMSDVFSFGLILYELLTDQPAFSKELKLLEIAFIVNVKHKLPDIPEFVLPSVRELIKECWAQKNLTIGYSSITSWIDSRK